MPRSPAELEGFGNDAGTFVGFHIALEAVEVKRGLVDWVFALEELGETHVGLEHIARGFPLAQVLLGEGVFFRVQALNEGGILGLGRGLTLMGGFAFYLVLDSLFALHMSHLVVKRLINSPQELSHMWHYLLLKRRATL